MSFIISYKGGMIKHDCGQYLLGLKASENDENKVFIFRPPYHPFSE
jgi:hypothetical protein